MTYDPKNLGWTAQCYMLGELSEAESAAFETLLETDQTARESLALAVELAEGCRLAEAEIEIERLQPLEVASGGGLVTPAGLATSRDTCSGNTLMRPVGWLAVGAAACLAMLIGWQSLPGVLGLSGVQIAERELSPEVTAAWATMASDDHLIAESIAHAADDLADAASVDRDMADDDMLDDATLDGGDIDAIAPSWLLAAVEARQLQQAGN